MSFVIISYITIESTICMLLYEESSMQIHEGYSLYRKEGEGMIDVEEDII